MKIYNLSTNQSNKYLNNKLRFRQQNTITNSKVMFGNNNDEEKNKKRKQLIIGGSILLTAAAIAAAVWFMKGKKTTKATASGTSDNLSKSKPEVKNTEVPPKNITQKNNTTNITEETNKSVDKVTQIIQTPKAQVTTNEIKNNAVSLVQPDVDLPETEEKSGYKKDDKKVDIIIKSLEFLNDNLEVTYDRNNVPGLKLNIFLRNASSYLKKYPELLSEYKILGIVFNENGIKSIEELYNERNSENARLIDNIILSVISVDNVPEREDIRIYLCELISNYNQKTIDFYRNMKYGKVFIDDEMKLADNLRVMMNKSKYLNTVLRSMGMENKQGVVL